MPRDLTHQAAAVLDRVLLAHAACTEDWFLIRHKPDQVLVLRDANARVWHFAQGVWQGLLLAAIIHAQPRERGTAKISPA